MKMIRTLVLAALAAWTLSACTVYKQVPPDSGASYDRRGDVRSGPAYAKDAVRTIFDKTDIPTPIVGCVGNHSARSSYIETERGVSYVVKEKNSRDCPETRLNFYLDDGTTDVILLAQASPNGRKFDDVPEQLLHPPGRSHPFGVRERGPWSVLQG